jgi:Ca-activated chloride channel family protein
MKRFSIISLLFLISLATFAQNERKVIREGVKAYQEGDYSDAEVQFRKAQDINNESFAAEFNTGAALYGQEKYEETVKQFEPLTEKSSNPETLSKIWHNVGNSLLEAQQYEPSIEAFKNSLRLNPTDTDTKYNLAYAKMKLQEQQQQQQNQDQQNKDQQNEDQQDKEQQNEDQQDQDQQNEDQQDQEQQNEDQQDQEQQGKPQAISKEDAERMLNAIQQQEKDVKGKVDKKKAAVAKVKTEKDW